MAKIFICPHCGGEEFVKQAAARDIFRITDGKPEIIRSEADDFAPLDGLICNYCGEDAPQVG